MKKPSSLLLILIICCNLSYSQLRVALVGGAHSSSVIETNNLPGWDDLKNKYSSRTGVHFGFLADLQLGAGSKFYLQPGIIFYNKGRIFSNTYDTSVYNYFSIDQKLFLNYIEAPLNLIYKIPVNRKSKFFLGGGPYFSLFYNGKENTEIYLKSGKFATDEDDDLPVGNAPGKYKTLDFGVNGTAGIEFRKFFIAANYSRSISDFYQAIYDGSFKHQVIGGTIGFFLGKPEYVEPKIKDADKDGVPDNDDECKDIPGAVFTKGCPDSDGDGIADKDDKCPLEKGTLVYNGCPLIDSDGDGINDNEDNCINIPGIVKYKGCPVPDTDKDGINDELDSCINIPGLEKYAGCPVPDTDADGVNDEDDKCIQAFGTKENQGCPEIKKELIEQVKFAARKIQFAFAKATLLKESETVLDEVAGILIKNQELKLDIEGHTSAEGNFNANMKLSADRAESVQKYLISKGIDKSRLTAKGFGPTRPINYGKSELERSLNRRVELLLKAD